MTYCRNATLGRRDFYRHLCHTLGLHPTSVAANLFLAVETHVQELRRVKVHPVFLLDEVHLLQPDLLGHLHILMNYEWDAKALLSLVLVGLPELEANLSRRAHRSLLTRTHHRFLIAPATIEYTAEYVRFPLAAAGSDRALFPDDALAALQELSQGALREMDRLATAALRDAVRRKSWSTTTSSRASARPSCASTEQTIAAASPNGAAAMRITPRLGMRACRPGHQAARPPPTDAKAINLPARNPIN